MEVAVVTGASSGIGKALYEGLKAGFGRVVGISRRGPDIRLDVRLVRPDGPPIVDRCDLLVNCAGIMPLQEGDGREIMEVNFWGAVNVTMNLLPLLKASNGCVINVSSVSAFRPDKYLPFYAASKAALTSWSKAMALKLAPDVRVNCLSPGFVKTNLVPGETPQELVSSIPMGREAESEELVEIVLAIWRTKYMTGADIVVDGGVSL